MKKSLQVLLVTVFVCLLCGSARALTYSFDDLSGWTGKNDGLHSGEIIADPLGSGENVLHFTATSWGGEIFTTAVFVAGTYRLSFDYLGIPVSDDAGSGGFVGFSSSYAGSNDWLAGTQNYTGSSGPVTVLPDTGEWEHVTLVFTADQDFHLMLEDFYKAGFKVDEIAGNAYFDNLSINAVPLPGAFWLLGSGLFGLVVLRRRQG